MSIKDAETLEASDDAEDARLAAQAQAEWVAAGRPACITLEELAAQRGIELATACGRHQGAIQFVSLRSPPR